MNMMIESLVEPGCVLAKCNFADKGVPKCNLGTREEAEESHAKPPSRKGREGKGGREAGASRASAFPSGSLGTRRVRKVGAIFVAFVVVMVGLGVTARAQVNQVPNPDFNDPTNPLKGWRFDFPYSQPYAKNAGYISISKDKKMGSANVVEITEPKAVAENEGAKIESAFIKAEPGATYHAAIDCLTGDLSAKCYIQVWALDPSASDHPDLYRVPARDGTPALVMVGRSEFEPPGTSKVWTTAKKDYKVPDKVVVMGQVTQPAFVSLQVFAFSVTTKTVPVAKADFTRFSLTATKSP